MFDSRCSIRSRPSGCHQGNRHLCPHPVGSSKGTQQSDWLLHRSVCEGVQELDLSQSQTSQEHQVYFKPAEIPCYDKFVCLWLCVVSSRDSVSVGLWLVGWPKEKPTCSVSRLSTSWVSVRNHRSLHRSLLKQHSVSFIVLLIQVLWQRQWCLFKGCWIILGKSDLII